MSPVDTAGLFPYPKDEPARISGLQKNYGLISTDLTTAATKVQSDASVMGQPGTWTGGSADACHAEVTGNTPLIGAAARAFTDATTALGPYGRAIDKARGDIDVLRRDYQTAWDTHQTNLANIRSSSQDRRLKYANEQDEIGTWNTTASGLHARYDGIMLDVDNAGRAAGNQLTELASNINGQKLTANSTPADVSAALAAHLPMLQHQQGIQDARALREAVDNGKNPDPDLLWRIHVEAGYEDYAGAFANELGENGLMDIAGKIDTGDFNDTQRHDMMASVATIIGTATDGAGPDLSRGEIDKLVKDASDFHGDIASAPGMTRSQVFTDLMKVSSNWGAYHGPSGTEKNNFLARVGGELFDHRQEIMAIDSGSLASDPLLIAVDKMRSAPDAAREFFAAGLTTDQHTPDRLNYMYRHYGIMADAAPIAMDAVRAAANDYPNDDRTGHQGQLGATIASYFLHDVARDDVTDNGDVMNAVTSILTTHYGELSTSLRLQHDYPPGAEKISDDPLFNGDFGAIISYGDAQKLLAGVLHDGNHSKALYQAAAVYGQQEIHDSVVNGGDPGAGLALYGQDLRRIIDAAHKVDSDIATDQAALDNAVKMGSGVLGVFIPGADKVGATASNVMKLLKSVGDSGLALDNPVAAEAAQYQSRLADGQSATDNMVLTALLREHKWPDPATDPTLHPELGWTDENHVQHSYFNPRTGALEPPDPKNRVEWDKYTKWRESLITDSHIQQDYRERIDDAFKHPVDNH
ncbi:MAG TPA: hypothetical protein VHC49_07285 [Mycobacteriales bacterium]|nr:hypothetical protein [Mycobacteriales bacterium]